MVDVRSDEGFALGCFQLAGAAFECLSPVRIACVDPQDFTCFRIFQANQANIAHHTFQRVVEFHSNDIMPAIGDGQFLTVAGGLSQEIGDQENNTAAFEDLVDGVQR